MLTQPLWPNLLFSAGIDRAASALSSSALLRIAEGQLSSAKAEWEQMRNDPLYLVNVITQTAHNCVEALIPDRRTGEMEQPEQLLRTPHFVASKLRYSAHNLLLTVGDWSLIVDVLRDIEKLDDKVGRFGDRGKRDFLMAQVCCSSTALSRVRHSFLIQVKQVLDTHQQSLFKDFYLTALTDVPFIRKNVTRDIVSLFDRSMHCIRLDKLLSFMHRITLDMVGRRFHTQTIPLLLVSTLHNRRYTVHYSGCRLWMP